MTMQTIVTTLIGGGRMIDRIVFKNNYVDIDIAKTLSAFTVDSAIGKSYLSYALRDVPGIPSIRAYTSKIDYERLVERPWLEGDDVIYILDRYDMRRTDKTDELLRTTSGRCVIVDVKEALFMHTLRVPFACVSIERPDVRRFVLRNGDLYRRQSIGYE